jgi:hypothetical protein
LSLGADIGKYAETGRDTSLGFLAMAALPVSDDMSAGVRAEYITKTAGVAGSRALQVTAGPQIKMAENVMFKTDYTFLNTVAITGATAVTSHQLAADVVYSF